MNPISLLKVLNCVPGSYNSLEDYVRKCTFRRNQVHLSSKTVNLRLVGRVSVFVFKVLVNSTEKLYAIIFLFFWFV